VDCAEPEKTRESAVVELTESEGVTVGVKGALKEATEGETDGVDDSELRIAEEKALGEGDNVLMDAVGERVGADTEGIGEADRVTVPPVDAVWLTVEEADGVKMEGEAEAEDQADSVTKKE